jgi:hypothetical protein
VLVVIQWIRAEIPVEVQVLYSAFKSCGIFYNHEGLVCFGKLSHNHLAFFVNKQPEALSRLVLFVLEGKVGQMRTCWDKFDTKKFRTSFPELIIDPEFQVLGRG